MLAAWRSARHLVMARSQGVSACDEGAKGMGRVA